VNLFSELEGAVQTKITSQSAYVYFWDFLLLQRYLVCSDSLVNYTALMEDVWEKACFLANASEAKQSNKYCSASPNMMRTFLNKLWMGFHLLYLKEVNYQNITCYTSGGTFFHFSGARETASMTQGISFQVKRLIYEETQFGY